MPVSVARLLMSSVKASIPPAEAPTAAINRSFLRSGAGLSSFGELRGWLRPGDFDFIYSLQSSKTARGSSGGGERVAQPLLSLKLFSSDLARTGCRMPAKAILVLPRKGNNSYAGLL